MRHYVQLGVNIDHVATIREARKTYEPDPVWAASECHLAGADGITVHLREDRRHINDRDVALLKETVNIKFNLELSLADEIVDIAVNTAPDQATLVPEKREEVTTEGGLDLIGTHEKSKAAVKRLQAVGTKVAAFIDPNLEQVKAAADLGFDAIELHTGTYALAEGEEQERQLQLLIDAGAQATVHGLTLHAGHGLNYHNTMPVAGIPNMRELNIGHAIVSRAIFIGMRSAVREMRELLNHVGVPGA